jgi:hypothetical protein
MLKLLLATPIMGNSKAKSVAPLPAVEIAEEVDSGLDRARAFHFAVTWVTLFKHLNPIESAGPRPRVEIPSPGMALVPVVASPPARVEQPPDSESSAAWEMVVPKMIRTEARTFVPETRELL